jgi:hypothetical protein
MFSFFVLNFVLFSQCTALRHVVAACHVSEESVREMFASVRTNDTPAQSLNQREFAGMRALR